MLAIVVVLLIYCGTKAKDCKPRESTQTQGPEKVILGASVGDGMPLKHLSEARVL